MDTNLKPAPKSAMSTLSRTPAKAGAMRNLSRLIYVVWMLLPEYRALRRFVRGAANDKAPARFVARLVALGPAFVKLGQMLSTRPDLMPGAYVDALSRLQENAPEIPGEAIRTIIENQLGKPVEELFATFGPRPVAAASLSRQWSFSFSESCRRRTPLTRPGTGRRSA